jgi:hypothetical protein
MFELTANMTQKQLKKMLKKVEKESDIINKQNISNNHKDFLQLAWWGTRLRAKALLLNERLAQTECHPAPCTRAIGTHNEDNTFKAIVWLKGRRDENGKGHPALKEGCLIGAKGRNTRFKGFTLRTNTQISSMNV